MLNTVFLILVSFVGAIYDWKKRRIPNWLTFGAFLVVLIVDIFHFKIEVILDCILGFLLGILLLFIPYLLGIMGAGDVKLLGALGAIAGFKNVVLVFLYTTIIGLFLGLFWIILKPGHLKFLITTGQALPPVDKQQKFPYGIAIFMGTILYIILGLTTSINLDLTKLIWQPILH